MGKFIHLYLNFTDIKVGSWMRKERVHVGQSQSKALCLPFYSILLAMGNPTVDYFSLDVEGAELPILKTIPWDKVDIKVAYQFLELTRHI